MRQTRRSMAFLLAAVMLLAALAGCTKPADTTKKEDPAAQAPAGKQLEFTLMAYTRDRPYNTVKDKLAEAIQQELAKSGVKVNIKALPWAEHLDAVRKKEEGDAFLMGWIGDNGDVDNFLYTFFHSSQTEGGLNNAKFKSATVDNLLTDAQQTADPKKRAEFYLMTEKLVSEAAVWLPISHGNDYMAHTKKVSGMYIHPTGLLDLRNLKLDGKSEFVFGRGGDSVSLDPALIEDGSSAQVVEQIFEGLYTYKPENTDVIPLLAAALPEIDKSGKVYTIPLKKDIKFHDGTPFNAAAVKYSIERLMKGKIEEMPYADFTFGKVEKIEAKDDYTVVITLKEPVAPFLANLAMGLAAPIVSPTAHQKFGDKFGENPVGTGPFVFKSWAKDQQIVLEKNPNYWNKDVASKLVDKVIFKVIKESSLKVDSVIKGEVDAIDGIAPADVKRLKDAQSVTLLSAAGMNISYMGFRTDRPPFNDKKLRQAIVQLVNRDAMVKALYGDTATPALTYLPPFMQKSLEAHFVNDGAQPTLQVTKDVPAVGMALPYNAEKGKALLKELGYSFK
ncbi:MAG TPA: ABC transporter substrate-binding protein [Symbiobacteriaceae bacterium]|nr:ABC transporter substrate-binding protein [Symbiobacteriaceae bacterium]